MNDAVPLIAQCVGYAESVVARAPGSEDAPGGGDCVVGFFLRNDGSAAMDVFCVYGSSHTRVCLLVVLGLRWSLHKVG